MRRKISIISIASVVALAGLGGGCGSTATQPAGNAAVSTNGANSMASPVPTAAAAVASTIEASEPNSYSATVRLTAMTTSKETKLPAIVTNVARDGEKRRVSFRLPNNEEVIYLNANAGGTRYLILPGRKQYVEVTSNDVGFEMPRFMMPDQIVDRLKAGGSFERVGEEQMGGRTVIKYRAAGSAPTNTEVGKVDTESFTYVDKETGLPLRAELESRAQGSVQGVEGIRTVVEMSDIKTDLAPALFDVPEGYEKITGDQIRNQINGFTQAVGAVAGALLQNLNQPSTTPTSR